MDAELPAEVPNPTPAPPNPMSYGSGTTSPDDDGVYQNYDHENEHNYNQYPSKGQKMIMDDNDSSNDANENVMHPLSQSGAKRNNV